MSATTIPANRVYMKLSQGGSPETFGEPGGFNTKGLNLSSQFNDYQYLGGAYEKFPQRLLKSASISFSGSGFLTTEDVDTWRAWWESGDPKRARLYLDGESGGDGGYYEGEFVLPTLNIGAPINELTTLEVEVQSSGEVEWTPAA